jgi:hypothetical protein
LRTRTKGTAKNNNNMDVKTIKRKECMGLSRAIKGKIYVMAPEQASIGYRFIFNKGWQRPKLFLHSFMEEVRSENGPWYYGTVNGKTWTTDNATIAQTVPAIANTTGAIGATWTAPAGTTTIQTTSGEPYITGTWTIPATSTTLSYPEPKIENQRRARSYFLFRSLNNLFALPVSLWASIQTEINKSKEQIIALDICRTLIFRGIGTKDDYEEGYTVKISESQPTVYELMKARTQKSFI